jgi:hypothetical protein
VKPKGHGARPRPYKRCNPDADALVMAEGNMSGSDRASSQSVRRSRRPHSTPRNFMHENRETSETPAVQPDSRSAGEGLGRTACGYVCEESHCGVVPMNHSNKDKQSSAESGEGRLRLKENAHSSDTYPTPSGTARVPQVRECTDKVLPLAVTYLREEPDALMSARPGPSGGYHASDIPTGIK